MDVTSVKVPCPANAGSRSSLGLLSAEIVIDLACATSLNAVSKCPDMFRLAAICMMLSPYLHCLLCALFNFLHLVSGFVLSTPLRHTFLSIYSSAKSVPNLPIRRAIQIVIAPRWDTLSRIYLFPICCWPHSLWTKKMCSYFSSVLVFTSLLLSTSMKEREEKKGGGGALGI